MSNYWKSGMRITSARLNRALPVSARKLVATPRTSTTTLEADNELVLPLLVNTSYWLTGGLLTTGGDAAGDFKYDYAWTGTMTVMIGGIGPVDTIASGTSGDGQFQWATVDTSSPSSSFSYATSATGVNIQISAMIEVGATAGNLSLRHAQLSSNATPTNLEVGSWLVAVPVGFN